MVIKLERKPLEKLIEDHNGLFKINGFRVVYNRLYLDPCTIEDSKFLLNKDSSFFNGCERVDQEMEGRMLLLFNVKASELKGSRAAQETLIELGITDFVPLNPKKPEAGALKCICSKSEDVVKLLKQHYGYRKNIRLLLNNPNRVVYARVEPDGANPKQCFKCFQLGHFKSQCNVNVNFCAKCGSTHHVADECTVIDYSRCLLCKKTGHGSLDHGDCEKFKEARRVVADSLVAEIIGEPHLESKYGSKVDPVKTYARVAQVDTELDLVNKTVNGLKKDVSALNVVKKNQESQCSRIEEALKKMDQNLKQGDKLLKRSNRLVLQADQLEKIAKKEAKIVENEVKSLVKKALKMQREEYLATASWHGNRLTTIELRMGISPEQFEKHQQWAAEQGDAYDLSQNEQEDIDDTRHQDVDMKYKESSLSSDSSGSSDSSDDSDSSEDSETSNYSSDHSAANEDEAKEDLDLSKSSEKEVKDNSKSSAKKSANVNE
jgi:hypothetical protein